MTRTLVLPGGGGEQARYRVDARSRGESLVGASSINRDPAAADYESWVYLPSVHEDSFLPALRDAISTHDITAVYCPHNIIHERLRQLIADGLITVRLINHAPAEIEADRMTALLDRAAPMVRLIADITGPEQAARNPSHYEIASLLMFSDAIVGQSSDEKIAALLALFPGLPAGDIVEIGAFWGQSSFLMAWAASRYATGKVLAVDPWNPGDAVQTSSPELVQRDTGLQRWDLIHEGFKVALALFGPDCVNFLRHPSVRAIEQYGPGRTVDNPSFGRTEYAGRISLLHIDGNHDYEYAALDRDTWAGLVQPGGWVVFDDYVWPHGNGPQRAGDEFLDANNQRIDRAFVCGKALFVRLSGHELDIRE